MDRLIQTIKQNTKKILWICIILYIVLFSAICILKYNHFLYNALDLAIINNTFYNTLHGHTLWSSVQGHSYLGDHFTPIIFLLLPFYAIYPSPITLLIVQTIFLALAALPIYKISQYLLKQKIIPLLLAILWLLNPLVHNINLFEFHFLFLIPFLFLTTFYFYLKLAGNQNKKLFLYFYIFIFLCLLIREDIAFIMLTFGAIILIDKIKNKNIPISVPITVILLSTFYFLLSTKLINHFSPSRFSPFAYYYSWLTASSLPEIIKHLFTIQNTEMIIGLLIPSLFIPLTKPKYLIMGLIPAGQLMLSAAGGGPLIWQTHYSALFLPALIISFIYGFQKSNEFISLKLNNKYLLIILLFATNIYTAFTLGPIKGINKLFYPIHPKTQSIVNQIPADSSIMTSYDFLPNLSSRAEIYSLHYYFLSQQQFAATAYILPQNPDYILINTNDLISYDLHLKNLDWTKKYYAEGPVRLRQLLKNYGVVTAIDNIILFKKDYQSNIELYSTAQDQQPIHTNHEHIFDNKLKLNGYKLQITNYGLQLSLSLEPLQSVSQNCYLKLTTNNQTKYFPLAYGLYPATKWTLNEAVTTNYWLDITPETNINIELTQLEGGLEIDSLRSTNIIIDKEISLGQIKI